MSIFQSAEAIRSARARASQPGPTAEQAATAAAVIAGRLRCDHITARRVADRLPAAPLEQSPAWQAWNLPIGELQALANRENQ